jgi:hypothetical protein
MRSAYALAAAITAVAASPALALTASATFDLEKTPGDCTTSHPDCYNSLESSYTATNNGVAATFTARAFSSGVDIWDGYFNQIAGATIETGKIGRYSGGAGVINSSASCSWWWGCNGGDGDHTVDSSGWFDFIEVSFDTTVNVKEVEFGYFTAGSDNFRFLYDSNGDGAIGNGDFLSDEFDIPSSGEFTNSALSNIAGTLFAFGAFDLDGCSACDKDDFWKLKSVTVHYEMTAVPLPASALLLLGSLGGFAFLRRPRR